MMHLAQPMGAALLVLSSALMWVSRGRRWRVERGLRAASIDPPGADNRRQARERIGEVARSAVGRWTLDAAIICLAEVGILDLWLLWLGDPTITQYVRTVLPGWTGVGVMIYALGQTWAVFGARGLLPAVNACIWGHLFW